MSEENESRPIEARTETEPRPQTEPRPDRERQRRPRRRYPRRRNYNSDYMNSDRESGFNNDAPAESSSDVQTDVVNAGEGETGEPREPEFGEGIIEISGKGFGFLRDPKRNFVQAPQDIFVTPEIVRRFGLRDGMWIYGETRRGNRGPQLIKLLKINEDEPTKYQGLRPFEELTDFKRSHPKSEIIASSNDSDIKSHTRIAQLAIERAKRLVEAGKHVFILLDSITRTARAFNNAMGGGGRTMSGGIDARAMETPRKLFSAARNTEEAGSLTIVATALIETGSRMDELIFQEFKGTGNMEMVLDRKISDQRIYPAVDIFLSGTRREELLLQPWELEKINLIRRGLAGHKPGEAIERLLMFVKKFPTNEQMLKGIPG